MKASQDSVQPSDFVKTKYPENFAPLLAIVRINWIFTIILASIHTFISFKLLDVTCERCLPSFNAICAGTLLIFGAFTTLSVSLQTPVNSEFLERTGKNVLRGHEYIDVLVVLGVKMSIISSLLTPIYGFYVVISSIKCKTNGNLYYIATVATNCADLFYVVLFFWLSVHYKDLKTLFPNKPEYNSIKLQLKFKQATETK